MDLLTNELKDLVINQEEINRVLKYTNVSEEQFVDFVVKVFNSDKAIEEEAETDDFLLTGDFITGDQFKNINNIFSVGIFPKSLIKNKIYQIFAHIQFEAVFFEYDDLIYRKLSKEIELNEVDYPYVYISKMFNESSFLIFEEFASLKVPFSWIEQTDYPTLFNNTPEFKNLVLLNFGT